MARAQTSSLVATVKAYPQFAQRALTQYKTAKGVTPEYLEALSWVGRGAFASKDYAAAQQNAEEVRRLCLEQLTHRKLDAEPSLPTALGASIEVQAEAAAAQGRRDEAVTFLRGEVKRWTGTSIQARIQKNLNLLTLEGKPAPPLRNGPSFAQHRGHPILLFFWAHWCGDCKNEVAVIAKLQHAYGPRGLVVIAPTQHYGYAAAGQEVTPAVETQYIQSIFAEYYKALGPVEVPLSEENFAAYGVSTTPTLTLIDRQGIVRLYHPGTLDYDSLAARIEKLLH
jgi:thiol-disulfide isomerase/thioredoxin